MQDELAQKNHNEGSEYLENNSKMQGVVVTESGLQYKVVESGSEQGHPKATDTVRVHYTGRFIDGGVFDSSVQRGEPAVFMVQQVISGWIEALQLMTPGSKWEVSIPSELAYGDFAPPSIGPNKTLIFDIELLEVL